MLRLVLLLFLIGAAATLNAQTPAASATPTPTPSPTSRSLIDSLSTGDVQKAMTFAAANNLKVAPRGGGHSYVGASTANGTMVLDLRQLPGDVNYDAGTGRLANRRRGGPWRRSARFGHQFFGSPWIDGLCRVRVAPRRRVSGG